MDTSELSVKEKIRLKQLEIGQSQDKTPNNDSYMQPTSIPVSSVAGNSLDHKLNTLTTSYENVYMAPKSAFPINKQPLKKQQYSTCSYDMTDMSELRKSLEDRKEPLELFSSKLTSPTNKANIGNNFPFTALRASGVQPTRKISHSPNSVNSRFNINPIEQRKDNSFAKPEDDPYLKYVHMAPAKSVRQTGEQKKNQDFSAGETSWKFNTKSKQTEEELAAERKRNIIIVKEGVEYNSFVSFGNEALKPSRPEVMSTSSKNQRANNYQDAWSTVSKPPMKEREANVLQQARSETRSIVESFASGQNTSNSFHSRSSIPDLPPPPPPNVIQSSTSDLPPPPPQTNILALSGTEQNNSKFFERQPSIHGLPPPPLSFKHYENLNEPPLETTDLTSSPKLHHRPPTVKSSWNREKSETLNTASQKDDERKPAAHTKHASQTKFSERTGYENVNNFALSENNDNEEITSSALLAHQNKTVFEDQKMKVHTNGQVIRSPSLRFHSNDDHELSSSLPVSPSTLSTRRNFVGVKAMLEKSPPVLSHHSPTGTHKKHHSTSNSNVVSDEFSLSNQSGFSTPSHTSLRKSQSYEYKCRNTLPELPKKENVRKRNSNQTGLLDRKESTTFGLSPTEQRRDNSMKDGAFTFPSSQNSTATIAVTFGKKLTENDIPQNVPSIPPKQSSNNKKSHSTLNPALSQKTSNRKSYNDHIYYEIDPLPEVFQHNDSTCDKTLAPALESKQPSPFKLGKSYTISEGFSLSNQSSNNQISFGSTKRKGQKILRKPRPTVPPPPVPKEKSQTTVSEEKNNNLTSRQPPYRTKDIMDARMKRPAISAQRERFSSASSVGSPNHAQLGKILNEGGTRRSNHSSTAKHLRCTSEFSQSDLQVYPQHRTISEELTDSYHIKNKR